MSRRARRDEPWECPCGTGRSYADCCAPYHRGEREAEEPARLVRSRFSAFARGEAPYLWRTLHAEHDDRARTRDEVVRELERACRAMRCRRLEILDARTDGAQAQVLFRARLAAGGQDRSFVELSDFLHDGTGWRYLCGVLRPHREEEVAELTSIEAFRELLRAP